MLTNNKTWCEFLEKGIRPYIYFSDCSEEIRAVISASLLNCNSTEQVIGLLTSQAHGEIFRTLNGSVDFVNVALNLEFFQKIIDSTREYLRSPLKHHQHSALRRHLSYNADTICYLWGLAIFLGLIETPAVVAANKKPTQKIMISVLFVVSEHLRVIINVLYNQDNNYVRLTRLLYKKYIHIILNRFSEEHPTIMRLTVEKKEEILTLSEFLKSDLNKPTDPRFNKITTINLMNEFVVNVDKKFNVGSITPNFFQVENTYYVYRLFHFGGTPLIIENNCKPDTIITEDFILAAKQLAKTKFIIDVDMLHAQINLVELEIKTLLNQAEKLTLEKDVDLVKIKLVVTQLLKDTNTLKYKRQFIQNKLKMLLNADAESTNVLNQLDYYRKVTTTSANLFKKNKEEHELEYTTRELQSIFSKVYTLTTFLSYVDYIKQGGLKQISFIPRADFRGRLYYDSLASIQSLWCFRFIYYYTYDSRITSAPYPLLQHQLQFIEAHPEFKTHTPVIEFFQAIGVLFKTRFLDLNGVIKLHSLLEAGYTIFIKLENASLEDYVLEAKDSKDAAELYYYINAIKSIKNGVYRGYYI